MSMRKTCVCVAIPGEEQQSGEKRVCETLGRYCNAIPWEILLSGKPRMGISSESHLRPSQGLAGLVG